MTAIQFPTIDTLPPLPLSALDRRYGLRYLIGGEVRVWEGARDTIYSPVCQRLPDDSWAGIRLGEVPDLSPAEAQRALAAAKAAWNGGRGVWPTMPTADRIACVERFVEGMLRVRTEVIDLIMWEIGKSKKDATTEFDRTVVYIRDTIEALKDLDRASSSFTLEEGFLAQIRRAPLGVVLCMGPFNYPLNETYTTLIPALIMGNVIISKTPKYGVLLHAPLMEAFRDAFPPGVVNIIQGDGATLINPIIASGKIDVLAFIGTSRVANLLKHQHPRPNRLRCVLGLEAKNPAIVLPDADLDLAVAEITAGALSYNGQRCTALKLIFVHESRAPEFLTKLSASVDKLKVGMPWEEGVQITPLPEAGKIEFLQGLVDDARAKGAQIVNDRGGKSDGTIYMPTVIAPVTPDMRIYTVEQFGPVIPVAVYRDPADIERFMQVSAYGQQVSIFGQDPEQVAGLIDALANQVCRINLNTQCRRGPDTFPFTGRKDSAEGTLSVSDALRVFSIRSVVATTATKDNKALVHRIVADHRSSFLSTDFLL